MVNLWVLWFRESYKKSMTFVTCLLLLNEIHFKCGVMAALGFAWFQSCNSLELCFFFCDENSKDIMMLSLLQMNRSKLLIDLLVVFVDFHHWVKFQNEFSFEYGLFLVNCEFCVFYLLVIGFVFLWVWLWQMFWPCSLL